MESKHLENLQVAQPGIEQPPKGSGWPTPLADASNPLRFKYTIGKSGSVEKRSVLSIKKGD